MNLRRDALAIFRAALRAADPQAAVRAALQQEKGLDRFHRILVVGAGKAGATMARAAESVLGKRISKGFVAVKEAPGFSSRRIEFAVTGHPVPDERGVRAARAITEIVAGAQAADLVLVLISGGASALLPAPAIPLGEKRRITQELLARGATIHEMNTVRKHLSILKGGQLAKLAAPATVLGLILSDVVGDNLDIIGSGPTVPDQSTIADARAVARKYSIRLPAKGLVETPKRLGNTTNRIVGSNRLAMAAASEKARTLGYNTILLSSQIEGEAREVAIVHAGIAKEIRATGHPVPVPACVLSGGETTVTIRGPGKGGRNQEFVLAAGIALGGQADTVVLSAGTDGSDGPTDAAGAIASGVNDSAAGYLARNDSYRYFAKYGGLVKTGPTGTNVMDVRVMLVGGPR
ncbi:MAG: glycerate kinase [Bryobacteraceae bacterium]